VSGAQRKCRAQDVLEVRVVHADRMHVIERIADVVDAQTALADPLRDQPGATVQIKLAYICRMRGIGQKGECPYVAAGTQLHFKQARRVHAPGHLALP
jgi:hypothetical protein